MLRGTSRQRIFGVWFARGLRGALPIIACTLVLTVGFSPTDLGAAEKFKPFQMKTLDGAVRTLQDFANTATLVSFFFPSCPYCNAAFPEVQKLHDKYKDQGLTTVWINVVPAEEKKIPEWMKKHGFTIPVLVGSSQASLQRDYKLKMTPTHYLLNSAGEILFSHAGYKSGDEEELEQAIQKALGVAP